MKLKKILAVSLVIAMSVATLAGCGKKAGSGAGSEDRSLYPGTAEKNELIVNLGTEPADMCSIRMTDNPSFNVLRHVIENLMVLDANDQPIPGVAKDYKVSDDKLTYTFNLREDMKWTNGEPVTAHDFVFAWTALLDPAYAAEYASFGYVFKNGGAFNRGEVGADQLGFKALGDYQLEVTLENPTEYFLSQLAFGVFAPVNEKAYNEFGEAYATDADKIVTNGPFKMTAWEHENKIVLEKNADYPDKDKIYLDKLTFLMINDTNAALNSFKAGEVDMIGVNGDQAKGLRAENYPVNVYDDGAAAYLEFNLKDPMLQNNNLRKALTYAIDKQAFVDAIIKNVSKPATSFTPPIIKINGKSFQAAVGELQPVFDKAKAVEFLNKAKEELGTQDLKITMISDDGDTAVKYASFVQEQIRANLGIEITVESMPFKSRIERMQNEDFSMVMALWGPDYNDPMTFLDLYESTNGNNHSSYANPQYDDLLAQIRKELDPNKRQEKFIELEKILLNDLPIGPIYWRSREYVYSGKIKSGITRTAFQDMNYRYVKLAK